jgi:hypothetical protein
MKLDVVVLFYEKFAEWPFVRKGLEDNREHINKVIVVNDDNWTAEGFKKVSSDILDIVHLGHDHDGFGAADCYNQALKYVTTPHFLHIGGDVVLRKGALAKNIEYIEPGVLVCGLLHDAEIRDGKLHQVREDIRLSDLHREPPCSEPWYLCRDGHIIIETAIARALGGYTKYDGYGFIDWDHAVRWFLYQRDKDAYVITDAVALHIGGYDEVPPGERGAKEPTDAMLDKFNALLKTYYKEFYDGHFCFTMLRN